MPCVYRWVLALEAYDREEAPKHTKNKISETQLFFKQEKARQEIRGDKTRRRTSLLRLAVKAAPGAIKCDELNTIKHDESMQGLEALPPVAASRSQIT